VCADWRDVDTNDVQIGQKFTLRVQGVQIAKKLALMVQGVQIGEKWTLVMCRLDRS